MLFRSLIAVALGLVAGVLVYEVTLLAHDLLFPGRHLLASLVEGSTLGLGQAFTLTLVWILSASASALVAGRLARNRWAGITAAGAWIVPLYLLVKLSGQPDIYLGLAFSIAGLAALIALRLGPSHPPEKTP